MQNNSVTWQEIHSVAASILDSKHIENASLEAEILLRCTMKVTRAELYANFREPATELSSSFWQMVECRLRGEPSAYLAKQREFFGLYFYVDRRVLIPRPESELLVEKALELTKTKFHSRDIIIADVGTGSGAIAVSLASHLPYAKIYATDISEKALEVARINCLKHRVGDCVILLQGDLLLPLPESADMVIANLPYVSRADYALLCPEIKDYEPPCALEGGEKGLDFIFKLMEQAPTRTRPGATLLLEIGAEQAQAVITKARSIYPNARVEVMKDFGDRDRVVVIEELGM